MAAPVRIESKAYTDWRYTSLEQTFGYPFGWGIGIMSMVWSHCTTERRHSLTPKALDAIAKLSGFADALVASELGEPQEDGTIRIRGTEGRIEWLDGLRERGRRGGVMKATNRLANATADASDSASYSPSQTYPLTLTPSLTIKTKDIVELLLDELNTESGRNFKPVKSNLKFIRARLGEGHSPEDISAVTKHYCAKWRSDAKMQEYIRPATLFNGEKFQGYLEQARASAVAPKPRHSQPPPKYKVLTDAERAELMAVIAAERAGGSK